MLDLGCGLGRHTALLSQMGFWVTGGDLAFSGLTTCAARLCREGLPFSLVRSDILQLPFSDGAFDALVSFNVIYHATWAGLQVVLSEIRRVLRPSSPFYLTFVGRVEEHIARYRADVARGICQELEPFTFVYLDQVFDDKDLPHHYCDEAEVRALLAGFAIEGLEPIRDEYVDADGVHHVSLHYHVQARRLE